MVKRGDTYGRRQGVNATLMQKMATESIHKYNKGQSNKTKHYNVEKIKLKQNRSHPTQNFCHLTGCGQTYHSIKKVTNQKCHW